MTRDLPPTALDLPDLNSVRGDEAPGWQQRAVVRFRDLLLTRHEETVTVIACDSNAGIGDRPADVLKQPARHTGLAAAKVAMMEVMAAGATPMVVVNTLGSARRGDGAEIVAGIEDCIRLSGHTPILTGSDETNIATVQSSVGVTVIGIVTRQDLLLGRSRAGDAVVVVGRPMDGICVPYAEGDEGVVSVDHVARLVAAPQVHEVLPVGSRGVRHEADELARTAGCAFLEQPSPIDMQLSAGSSTCVVVTCAPGEVARIGDVARCATVVIGSVEASRAG